MVTFLSGQAIVTKVIGVPVEGQAAIQEAGNGKLVAMHKVYLSLGSNVGDRAENLRTAIHHLGRLGKVVAVSSFYETEPVELTTQPWFLNCALELDTEKMPRQLINGVLAIERRWAAGAGKRKARATSTSTFCCLEIPWSRPGV